MVSYLKACLLLGVLAGSYGQEFNNLGLETNSFTQNGYGYGQNFNEPNDVGQYSFNYDPTATVQNVDEPSSLIIIEFEDEPNEEQNDYVNEEFVTYNNEPYATPQDFVNANGQNGTNQNSNVQSSNGQSSYGQSAYGQNAYGQNFYNQNAYGPNANAQNSYAQNAYGQSTNGQSAYGQNPNGQNTYAQSAYGQNSNVQNAYGQNSYNQSAYGQNTNGQSAYGQNSYSQNTYGQNANVQNAYVQNSYSQNAYGQSANGQSAYGQNSYNQNTYGQNANAQNAYGQNSYSQNAYGQNSNSQSAYGQNTNAQSAYGQNTNGQNTYSQNVYQQNAYAQNAYGQNSYNQNAYGQSSNSQNAYAQNSNSQNAYAQNSNSQNTYGQNNNYAQNYNQYTTNVPNYNEQYSQNSYGQNGFTSASAQASASANAGSQYYDEVLGFRVYRPCPNLNIDCIRNYFAANGQCTRASGSIPNRLYQQVSDYYYPSINMSLSQIGNVISGLNGTVNNFYVNPTTGITLLSVDYDPITIVTNANSFLYHLNGVEPIQGQVSSTEDFPTFQITTMFRGAGGIDLSNSYSVGFLNNVPKLSIYNPTEAEITNPLVSYMLSQLRSNFNTFVRESFVNRAQFFTAAFVQYTICDFGVNMNQPSNLPGAV